MKNTEKTEKNTEKNSEKTTGSGKSILRAISILKESYTKSEISLVKKLQNYSRTEKTPGIFFRKDVTELKSDPRRIRRFSFVKILQN